MLGQVQHVLKNVLLRIWFSSFRFFGRWIFSPHIPAYRKIYRFELSEHQPYFMRPHKICHLQIQLHISLHRAKPLVVPASGLIVSNKQQYLTSVLCQDPTVWPIFFGDHSITFLINLASVRCKSDSSTIFLMLYRSSLASSIIPVDTWRITISMHTK